MYPHTGHADVGGDGEVGQPKVLDLRVLEGLLDQGVETEPGHHAAAKIVLPFKVL